MTSKHNTACVLPLRGDLLRSDAQKGLHEIIKCVGRVLRTPILLKPGRIDWCYKKKRAFQLSTRS